MRAPPPTLLPQDATPGPTAADEGVFGWLHRFSQEPGVVEVLLAALVVGAVLLVWWRLARLVDGARSRSALRDYLLGVEQALQGDLAGARRRLTLVLAEDPENHYARLLLGKVLTGLGDAAEAHKHHLFLQRAFGIESAENELLLAQSLLHAGQPAEAAEVATRALPSLPARPDALEFVYRARLRMGDLVAAAPAGRRLLALLGGPSAQPQLARDVARTLARSGLAFVAQGDLQQARGALQAARAVAGDADQVELLAARLAAEEQGLANVVERLLGDGAARVPAVAGAQVPARAGRADPGRPTLTLAVPAEPWACRACGSPAAEPASACATCGAPGGLELREPALLGAVASPTHAMDAIDENAAHVRRLVTQTLSDDAGAAALARPQVLALREAAVPELLHRAWQGSERVRETAVELLRAMGPSITPVLFAASDAIEDGRILALGSRSPAALVGRIVQGFDRAALPHVEALFASARPEHRKILIDYFLGLGDVAEFQLVLERFPPVEILHRLNKCEGPVLRRFLENVPAGHFVAEVLLLEPTFHREDEVLAAIAGHRQPEVLERVLLQRGSSRSLVRSLIARLADERLAPVAARLLAGLGESALDHVLSAYTDPESAPAQAPRLKDLLVTAGASAARRLAAAFGPEPAALDGAIREVLAAIGDPAVEPLELAYGQSGWLERLGAGLLARHTNRRVQIVRALAAIGSAAAAQALGRLRDRERDANLKLRLEQALHELRTRDVAADETGEGGSRGQAG